MQNDNEEILARAKAALSAPGAADELLSVDAAGALPSVEAARRIMDLARAVLFARFFDGRPGLTDRHVRDYYLGANVDALYGLLTQQIARCMHTTEGTAAGLALAFIDGLPEVKSLLVDDAHAMFDGDPAAQSAAEVVFCYPGFQAMVHHRCAHALLRLGVPVLPRIISEMAHSATGIDIHPGAQIGRWFSIDHGTGVVIGETCVIGDHVSLYQGVTLGAKNFTLDAGGHPVNVPRHPVLEDWVTVYSNSSVLGRITVGHHSVIGGNVWLTHSVPANSRIVQAASFNN